VSTAKALYSELQHRLQELMPPSYVVRSVASRWVMYIEGPDHKIEDPISIIAVAMAERGVSVEYVHYGADAPLRVSYSDPDLMDKVLGYVSKSLSLHIEALEAARTSITPYDE
jgi:hypothetical protein